MCARARSTAWGILGLPENRLMFKVIAGDKRRPVKERGMAMVGLAMDNTQQSIDLIVWHLNYHRSSLRLNAWQMPTLPEEEKRRVAAHMLGFCKGADVNDLLHRVALGSRRWNDGVSGLAVTALGRRRARDYIGSLFQLMGRRDTPDAVKRSIPIALGMMIERNDTRNIDRLGVLHPRLPPRQHHPALHRHGPGRDRWCERVVEIFADLIRNNVINDDKDRAWLYLALGRCAAKSQKAQGILLAEYERARTQGDPRGAGAGVRHRAREGGPFR